MLLLFYCLTTTNTTTTIKATLFVVYCLLVLSTALSQVRSLFTVCWHHDKWFTTNKIKTFIFLSSSHCAVTMTVHLVHHKLLRTPVVLRRNSLSQPICCQQQLYLFVFSAFNRRTSLAVCWQFTSAPKCDGD